MWAERKEEDQGLREGSCLCPGHLHTLAVFTLLSCSIFPILGFVPLVSPPEPNKRRQNRDYQNAWHVVRGSVVCKYFPCVSMSVNVSAAL